MRHYFKDAWYSRPSGRGLPLFLAFGTPVLREPAPLELFKPLYSNLSIYPLGFATFLFNTGISPTGFPPQEWEWEERTE